MSKIKFEKATGEGYPKGYKESINAYMEGAFSGRFGQDKDKHREKVLEKANELLKYYHNFVKHDWQNAKRMAVHNFLFWNNKIEEYWMLYGGDSEAYKVTEMRLRISQFVSDSLPTIEDKGDYE